MSYQKLVNKINRLIVASLGAVTFSVQASPVEEPTTAFLKHLYEASLQSFVNQSGCHLYQEPFYALNEINTGPIEYLSLAVEKKTFGIKTKANIGLNYQFKDEDLSWGEFGMKAFSRNSMKKVSESPELYEYAESHREWSHLIQSHTPIFLNPLIDKTTKIRIVFEPSVKVISFDWSQRKGLSVQSISCR